jgi:uncharacterized membrane protein YqjE
MADEPAPTGIFASLRRMLANLLELGSTRLQLVSVEIQEQIEYAANLLLWGMVAIFFGSLTVLLLALTVVIAFWDSHRLLAAGLMTGLFAAIALIAASVVSSRLRSRPRFLEATTRELQRDAEALRDGDRSP